MKKSIRNFLSLIAFVGLAVGSASAQEFNFIWSDTHNEVLARHNAALYTPVNRPSPAVDWSFNRADAQQAWRNAYPEERIIVQRVEVVRQQELAEVDREPETIDINGREVYLQEDL